MKKWIAPLLVLALAVLVILCGKHITEAVLRRPQDRQNRSVSYSIAEIASLGPALPCPADTAVKVCKDISMQ